MAKHILIPANTFVDLYDASGIAVGTAILVSLIGGSQVRLFSSELEPTQQTDYVPLYNLSEPKANSQGDLGAWAYTVAADCKVSVEVL